MPRRLSLGLAALRIIAVGALLLLFLNPTTSRPATGAGSNLVLLDASLSMAGHGGHWREALDSAVRIAGSGPIWRFGGAGTSAVTGFDSSPPAAGSSRLGPALAVAAARGGAVTIITDGEVSDTADLPPDLRRRARVIVLPRIPAYDAFIASVEGPRQVAVGDTVTVRVAFGTAGKGEGGKGKGTARLEVRDAERVLISQPVSLPDSGVIATSLTLPPSRFPLPGLRALEIRLVGVNDSEPRDDSRSFVLEVSRQPTAVVLAAPPDWEARFLARTLGDVARVPVRSFVQTEHGIWRDARTLLPVASDEVARMARSARLVALVGDPAALTAFRRPSGELRWITTGTRGGDWYVDPVAASPLAGSLVGVRWDSLPPAAAIADLPADTGARGSILLSARLARRGPPLPIAIVSDSAGARTVTIGASGLWRWMFRGGSSSEAYRGLVAGIADYLLQSGTGSGERFAPEPPEAPNGMPVTWRWTSGAAPRPVALELTASSGVRTDTLRFDATGHAQLSLPPGAYRYAAVGGSEHGLVVVEQYSDEWRSSPVTLVAQPGDPSGGRIVTEARERWWLFAIAVAAFAAEWAWRRRQGLP